MSYILARLRIRSKIVLAFALMLCCTVALGIFALTQVRALTADADIIASNVAGVLQLEQVARGHERLRALDVLRLLARTTAERADLDSRTHATDG